MRGFESLTPLIKDYFLKRFAQNAFFVYNMIMKKIYVSLVSVGALIALSSLSSGVAHAGMIDLNSNTESQSTVLQNDNKQTPSSIEGWEIDQPVSLENYTYDAYAYQQCTWWVYNRAKEFGINYSTTMGNGGDWQFNSEYTVTTTPQLHSAVSFSPGQIVGGQWQPDPTYGHVAFVEAIHPDGSILISQSGLGFSNVVNYQVISATDALQLHYVIGNSTQ